MQTPTTESYDAVHKIFLIGDAHVGKSSLVAMFSDGVFHAAYTPTIGVDFKIFNALRDECGENGIDEVSRNTRLHIWDATGAKRMAMITRAYYRAAHGIAICFDVTSARSFDRVPEFLASIEQLGRTEIAVMLVACKCDVSADAWQVHLDDVTEFAGRHNLPIIQTSAASGCGVRDAFLMLTREIRKKQQAEATRRRAELRRSAPNTQLAVWSRDHIASACCTCSCFPFLLPSFGSDGRGRHTPITM